MSYEFTGRYSPSQIASGLQTYGSTGAAMSPEQNNPVHMPQNQAFAKAMADKSIGRQYSFTRRQ